MSIRVGLRSMARPAMFAPRPWLEGWGYRKSHEIDGTTEGAQTDYQVQVVVHRTTGTDSGGDVYVGTKCLATFADIRFTTDDALTLLDHWLESIVGDVATFWVEVASIPASPGSATIYIYYGDADAASASSYADTITETKGYDPIDRPGHTGTTHGISYIYDALLVSGGRRVLKLENYLAYAGGFRFQVFSDGGTTWDLERETGDISLSLGLNTTTHGTLTTHAFAGEYIGWGQDADIRTDMGVNGVTLRWEWPRVEGDTPKENWDSGSYVISMRLGLGKYVDPEPSHGDWGSEESA